MIEDTNKTENIITGPIVPVDNVIESIQKPETIEQAKSESVIKTENSPLVVHTPKNDLLDDSVIGISTDSENVTLGHLEEAPSSLLLADPPSGFKDSITDTVTQESQFLGPLSDNVTHYEIQNNYIDGVSLGSDSFDQAINRIDAAQVSADEDLDPTCNSLPPDLSQVKLVPSSLTESNLETTSDTIMPAPTSYKSSPSRPMSFSIGGYTERSKETSYTEKLKVGRSDSSGSSSDSSIR